MGLGVGLGVGCFVGISVGRFVGASVIGMDGGRPLDLQLSQQSHQRVSQSAVSGSIPKSQICW